MRSVVAAVAAGLALAAAAAAGPAAAALPSHASPSGGRWVVGADGAAAARELTRALESSGAEAEPLPRVHAIAVTAGSRQTVLEAIAGEPGLDYVEPALPRFLLEEPADAVDPSTGRPFGWAFGAVNAAAGIAGAGGGAASSPVAVVDTGVDRDHPDLTDRVLAGHDVLGTGSTEDLVGHGTFVAGLVSAVDGNGLGGRGVAGATPVIPIRVAAGTSITSADLAAGIVAAVDRGARVINVSIGGPGLSSVEQAALDYADARDVVVVASAGNSALDGNPVEFPAAAVGGESGGWSTGLSVGATDPLGRPAPFSTHNANVSIAAPGAGLNACADGVYSTIPSGPASLWTGDACDPIFSGGAHGAGRYAYGQGTSFSAPLVAGATALVRQVAPGLRAGQVTDVLRRSANQTLGSGWNPHTGAGVVNVGGAVELAVRYDATAPSLDVVTDARPGVVHVTASAEEQTSAGKELAGGAVVGLELSRDGSRWTSVVEPSSQHIDTAYDASADRPVWLRATACDRNHNCTSRSSGPQTGSAVGSPAPGTTGRLHASILALGVTRRCPGGRPQCLRIVVRAAPSGAGDVRFALRLRQPGRARAVGAGGGTLRAGLRRVVNVVPSTPLACGRVEARLTVRSGNRSDTAIRRTAVRRCAAPRPALT